MKALLRDLLRDWGPRSLRFRAGARRLPLAAKALELRGRREVARWRREGEPVPPPHLVKEELIADLRRRYQAECLIETGTYLGDMIEAQRRGFSRIYSIELNPRLAEAARLRFRRAPHVEILQGDSAQVLPELLAKVDARCLFWLDGHYSGHFTARASLDTPVRAELEAVWSHPRRDHVILIDDARLFNGQDDYPTLDEMGELVRRRAHRCSVEVRHDVIVICEPRPAGS